MFQARAQKHKTLGASPVIQIHCPQVFILKQFKCLWKGNPAVQRHHQHLVWRPVLAAQLPLLCQNRLPLLLSELAGAVPLVYSAELLLQLLAQDFRSYTTFAVPLCGPTAVVPPAFVSFILLLQRPGAVSRHSAAHMHRVNTTSGRTRAFPAPERDLSLRSRDLSRGFFRQLASAGY